MKAAFHTLGCKVNQYETEALIEQFRAAGYDIVGENETADVYVVNTCTVTHVSDRKSRQYIRRMKNRNPDAVIAVTGCYVQVSPEEVAAIPEVDMRNHTLQDISVSFWQNEEDRFIFFRMTNLIITMKQEPYNRWNQKQEHISRYTRAATDSVHTA